MLCFFSLFLLKKNRYKLSIFSLVCVSLARANSSTDTESITLSVCSRCLRIGPLCFLPAHIYSGCSYSGFHPSFGIVFLTLDPDCLRNSHNWNQEVTRDQQYQRDDPLMALSACLRRCGCVCVSVRTHTTRSVSSSRQELLLCSSLLHVCESAFIRLRNYLEKFCLFNAELPSPVEESEVALCSFFPPQLVLTHLIQISHIR